MTSSNLTTMLPALDPIDDLEAYDVLIALYPDRVSDESDEDDFEDLVHQNFGIDFEQFRAVAGALIALTPAIESPLTKRYYHNFGADVFDEQADGSLRPAYFQAAAKRMARIQPNNNSEAAE